MAVQYCLCRSDQYIILTGQLLTRPARTLLPETRVLRPWLLPVGLVTVIDTGWDALLNVNLCSLTTARQGEAHAEQGTGNLAA